MKGARLYARHQSGAVNIGNILIIIRLGREIRYEEKNKIPTCLLGIGEVKTPRDKNFILNL